MKSEKISLKETQQFSSLFLDYLAGNQSLKPFFSHPPVPESFKEIINEKSFPGGRRKVLAEVFVQQYQGLEEISSVKENIQLLNKENTYTVTTGHQLNIFTGPLYFIYKIVTVINTCRELKDRYPAYNFVPVYWMASEDHDYEEIRHFSLFGKQYKWETSQQGPVGDFSLQGLKELIHDLPEPVGIFEKAYSQNSTLSAAVRQYVHELFGQWGVLSLDASHPGLKSSFSEIIKADLLDNKAGRLVEQSSERLQEAGYKAQIFPREINFFYMKAGLRERIVKEGNEYLVLNTSTRFSEETLLKELESNPERFSPNVVMRPLYQEWILPNLAYVGGPAEVAYWLQLKEMFDHFKVAFPVLMPRNFALVISRSNQNKLEKAGLEARQLFGDTHQLKQHLLEQYAEHEMSLSEEKKELHSLFEKIKEKAAAVDKTLSGFVGAEATKSLKSLENIEKRIKKSEEKRHETSLNQVDSLKEKLFPNNSLQERTDNFLNFYINDPAFIEKLAGQFAPFDFSFNIFTYNE